MEEILGAEVTVDTVCETQNRSKPNLLGVGLAYTRAIAM